MSILGIDTSGKVSGVAVATGDFLQAEISVQGPLTHSETLMEHVVKALELAKVAKEKLAGIAVGIGPGSFTGLRIGLSAAKALSYGLNIPLVGVSTMHVLACHFYLYGGDLLLMIDAQKKNVYREVCRWEHGELVSVKPLAIIPLGDALNECQADGQPTIILGDGLKLPFKDELPPNAKIAPPALKLPRAAHVAWWGQKKLSAGESDDPMTLEPLYLRRSEAELLWEKRHGNAN